MFCSINYVLFLANTTNIFVTPARHVFWHIEAQCILKNQVDLYNEYLCSGASKMELLGRMEACDKNKDGLVELLEYTECLSEAMGWCVGKSCRF
jgi:hypothetical protein